MSCGGPSFWQSIIHCLRKDYHAGLLKKVDHIDIHITHAVFLITNEKITSNQLEKALIQVAWEKRSNIGSFEFIVYDKVLHLELFITSENIGGKNEYGYATMTCEGQVVDEKIAI